MRIMRSFLCFINWIIKKVILFLNGAIKEIKMKNIQLKDYDDLDEDDDFGYNEDYNPLNR